MKSNQLIITIIGFLFCGHMLAQDAIQSLEITPLEIGEQIQYHSDVLDENRIINIYLPQGYSKDSLKTYPVIYLLDGSMDEDFIHISGLVQFCSFSWINMIPESIVVGIANVDRRKDFTFPSNNQNNIAYNPTSGGSASFIRFIEEELQPMIENEYKTDTVKTVIGQSLGGLLATEILFKKPELFDNYIIVSPSLWWDDESLLAYSPNQALDPATSKKFIYIAVGKEGEKMERPAKKLYKLFKSSGHYKHLAFRFMPDKTHADALHEAVYFAFEEMKPED